MSLKSLSGADVLVGLSFIRAFRDADEDDAVSVISTLRNGERVVRAMVGDFTATLTPPAAAHLAIAFQETRAEALAAGLCPPDRAAAFEAVAARLREAASAS